MAVKQAKPTTKPQKKAPAARGRKAPNGSATSLLGQDTFTWHPFPGVDAAFAKFQLRTFKNAPARHRFRQLNEALLALVQKAPEPAFLFAAVIDFIDRVNRDRLLDEPFRFLDFESWLNNFSGLSEGENAQVRGKIVGKYVPREEFQRFFPIGMGKRYFGSHFVSAHISPDVDTTVASFSGWLDAFAARVGERLHIWSLPGGAPDSHITHILQDMFGPGLFTHCVRGSGTLTLTSMDLLTQQDLRKVSPDTLITSLDPSENTHAVVLIDDEGHYIGDWRASDLEAVRPIITAFSACLRWFENNLHVKLISFFTQPKPQLKGIPELIASIFQPRIAESQPAHDLSNEHKGYLDKYLRRVLRMPKGIEGTYGELIAGLETLGIDEISIFHRHIEGLKGRALFDASGNLKEDRPKLFQALNQIIQGFDSAVLGVRAHFDRLDMMMAIKTETLGYQPQFVTLHSDVEEIRHKMQQYNYLTVTIPERGGKSFPVGMVRAHDLRLSVLGTVTLRDFCNNEEIKMASYLQVISVIDHHKSSLNTASAPMALISDAQSCNVLIADRTFELNDRYSTGGLTDAEINASAERATSAGSSPSALRVQQRALQRLMAHQTRGPYFIHPQREIGEYLCFLYAILDDTDLLTKVSNQDVHCVAQLLNRLKSLSIGRDVEIVNFDDLPRDKTFAKAAAKKILQNKDMYSLYKRIYDFKEREVERNLELCAQGKPSNVFSDTKEQNGCSRVGQIKLFASNYPFYEKRRDTFCKLWLDDARAFYQEKPDVDLHMLMVSTITGADEVFHGQMGKYPHKDELWIWAAPTQLAMEHLTSFLNAFSYASEVVNNAMEVEFLGPNAADLDQLFARNFRPCPRTIAKKLRQDFPIAVLRFNAGTINSRKSSITPYIPKLIG